MITERDLDEAIAECEGVRKPNAGTCIKLAAFYTIKDTLYPKSPPLAEGYSYSPPPATDGLSAEQHNETIRIRGDSDFLSLLDGKEAARVWAVMDELMETLSIVNPRIYDGVLRRLREI